MPGAIRGTAGSLVPWWGPEPAPSVAPPAASQDGDGQPDRRDPEADSAHDDSEPAKHVHPSRRCVVSDVTTHRTVARMVKANELTNVIDLADWADDSKLGKGKEMQDRLSKLVGIFEGLDFSANRDPPEVRRVTSQTACRIPVARRGR